MYKKRQYEALTIVMAIFVTGVLSIAATFIIPTYGNPVVLVSGGAYLYYGSYFARSADFNCDGIVDVALMRLQFQKPDTLPIEFHLGNGQGGFVDSTSQIIGSNAHPTQHARGVVIDDFNGDGRADVFVADTGMDLNPFPGYQNTLLLSTSDCRMVDATGGLPQQSDYSHSAASADLDGDGDIDLSVQNQTWNPAFKPPHILFNDGTGRFSIEAGALPPEFEAYNYTNSYTANALVDVNADGRPDLVFGADQMTPSSKVLLNDGTGHFSVLPNALPGKPVPFDGDCLDIKGHDVNGDGFNDLLILFTKRAPNYYQGRWIQILINNGDGTFHDETSSRYPQVDNNFTWFISLQLLDIDGNGFLDVVGQVAYHGGTGGDHRYLLADAQGVFTAVSLFPLISGGPGVDAVFTFVDRNKNGHRDALGFGQAGGYFDPILGVVKGPVRVTVRPNTGPVLPPGIPQGITATRSVTDRVQIAWRYVWGATSYEVWRSSTPASASSRIGTTTAVAFTDASPVSDGAYYSVRAVNAAASSASSPSVLGKPAAEPVIQGHPRSQTIASGQTAILSVVAAGAPALSYQWYSGDSGDLSNPVAQATSTTFATPPLTSLSKYWVRVFNAFGATNSKTASIVMSGTPATVPVLSQLTPSNAKTGTNLTIALTGVSFVPNETTVLLSGDGATIGTVKVVSGTAATLTLTIGPNAAPGARMMTVRTPNGTSGSQSFTITRRSPTQITSQ